MIRIIAALAVFALTSVPGLAQNSTTPNGDNPLAEAPMTMQRLAEIIIALDPNAEFVGITFQMVIDGTPVIIVTDPGSDRMRAMTPIQNAEDLSPEDLLRMMQANFDTALDARYAIAQGTLWSTFIHPFAALEKDQFISGLGQTVNLARTFGTLYTGGGIVYGPGDSIPLQRQLIDDLLQQGEEI